MEYLLFSSTDNLIQFGFKNKRCNYVVAIRPDAFISLYPLTQESTYDTYDDSGRGPSGPCDQIFCDQQSASLGWWICTSSRMYPFCFLKRSY